MVENVDFIQQESAGEGRPDMIIRLPGGKSIAVDAKAPMQAYLEALELTDGGPERRFLERRLDEAPEDGGFGEFIAPFDPAILVAGINSLRIEALPSDSDIDDFEFVNIRIYLVPPAGSGLGAGTSPDTDARTTGTQ